VIGAFEDGALTPFKDKIIPLFKKQTGISITFLTQPYDSFFAKAFQDGQSKAGQYDGIDVSKSSIRWCHSTLSRRFSNFRFRHADVFNREYNPAGRLPAGEYVLPFEDRRFDFILLTSVFTHMLPRPSKVTVPSSSTRA